MIKLWLLDNEILLNYFDWDYYGGMVIMEYTW